MKTMSPEQLDVLLEIIPDVRYGLTTLRTNAIEEATSGS